jgi:hypothetical protein
MTRRKKGNALFVLLTSANLGLSLPQAATAADLSVKAPIYKAPMVAPVYKLDGILPRR